MKKNILKIYLLFFLGTLHSFCYNQVNSTEVSNEIVLIFQKCPPDINKIHLPAGNTIGSASDIQYMDSAMTNTRITLQKAPCSDTIVIHTNDNVVEVTHAFNAVDGAKYLFNKGDSVLFTYKENVPFATILNRETSFLESNFDIFMRKEVRKNELSAKYYYYYPFFRKTAKDQKEEIRLRKLERDNVTEEWIHEYKVLDSLHNAGLLPEYVYNYRKNSLVSEINSTCTRDTVFMQYPKIREILGDTVLFAANNDSLLQFSYYRSYLQTAKINNHVKDIKLIKIDNGGSGSYYPNYFVRFDTISNLDFLSAKAKKYFLKIEMEPIFEYGDRNDIEKYCEKYISMTGDSLFVTKLLTDNKMNLNYSDQLLLIDSNNNQTNLHEILEKNKGKVIYIDFWASWCAPCKRSMPDAKLLREEYKNKDVVFVYLAFKDEEEAWKRDEQKLEVNYLSKSYFITNSKTARIIVDWDVRYIPRYLLFNKKGELVHRNAPGPHEKEIREQLDKLLKE